MVPVQTARTPHSASYACNTRSAPMESTGLLIQQQRVQDEKVPSAAAVKCALAAADTPPAAPHAAAVHAAVHTWRCCCCCSQEIVGCPPCDLHGSSGWHKDGAAMHQGAAGGSAATNTACSDADSCGHLPAQKACPPSPPAAAKVAIKQEPGAVQPAGAPQTPGKCDSGTRLGLPLAWRRVKLGEGLVHVLIHLHDCRHVAAPAGRGRGGEGGGVRVMRRWG